MLNLQFEKGEIRRFEFTVRSHTPGDYITVASAGWKLFSEDSAVSAQGICDVSGTNISLLVPFQNEGKFVLEVTADIPPEIIKERIELKVN